MREQGVLPLVSYPSLRRRVTKPIRGMEQEEGPIEDEGIRFGTLYIQGFVRVWQPGAVVTAKALMPPPPAFMILASIPTSLYSLGQFSSLLPALVSPSIKWG